MQETPTPILIVDDDVDLTTLLSDYLALDNIDVMTAETAARGLELFRTHQFELVVLDVMLPDLDGLEVLRRMREISGVPVLMLSARGDPADRILGLELGADDYVPKPCPPRELSARIHAILRRMRAQDAFSRQLAFGGLTLDANLRRGQYEGRDLELTATQFAILEQLVRAGGRPVTKEQLYAHGMHRPRNPRDRAVDVHVSAIRAKLAAVTDKHITIESRRGIGYLLQSAVPPGAGTDSGESA